MSLFPWHPVDLSLAGPRAAFLVRSAARMVYARWRLQPWHVFWSGALAERWQRGRLRGHAELERRISRGEFPLEELEALEKTLKAISIPLGSSVFAFDGSPGLVRVDRGSGNNWIDLRYDSIEQPEWEPLLAFIHETSERFLPSPPSEMHDLFGEPEPAEPALPLCADEEGF